MSVILANAGIQVAPNRRLGPGPACA